MSPTFQKNIIYGKDKYFLRKERQVRTEQDLGGAQNRTGRLGWEKNLIFPAAKGDVPELTYMCIFNLFIFVQQIL